MPINKIRVHEATLQNLYAFIWDEDDNIRYLVGETFEAYGTNSRNASDYAITLTEVAVGRYTADWPSGIERGDYDVSSRIRVGDTPADSDWNLGGPVEKYWTGTTIAAAPETNALAICNRALAKMGGSKSNTYPITAVGDGEGGTSDNCERLYTPIRREVLKRLQPQECTYYDEFEESSFSGETGEWEYVFDFPSDCLIPIRQTDQADDKKEYRCKVMQNYLLSNDYSNDDGDAAYVEYIKNETDGTALSDEVVEAIVTKLAAELAPLEIGGEWAWKRRQQLLEEYNSLVLPTAKGINQSQQYNDEEKDASRYSFLGGRN